MGLKRKEKYMNNSLLIKKLVGVATLTALVVALQFLSNYVKFGTVEMTLALIPIAVGAILYGPLVGGFLGFIMGVIARQSIKGALANYLGVAIGFFVTFFVLTRYLTEEEIGLTRVMVDAAMLFSGLAQLGSNASIVRFFPHFKDNKDNHGIFGQIGRAHV